MEVKANADEEGVKTLIFQKSPGSLIVHQFPWTFELEKGGGTRMKVAGKNVN